MNHTFDWVALDSREAALLIRLRTEDFAASDWPDDIIAAITAVNDRLAATITAVAGRHGLDQLDMTLAVMDVPAAARRSILLGATGVDGRLRRLAIELVRHLIASHAP